MNAVILAAEGVSLAHARTLPSCLQPVMGGTNMLDQQVRLLNLFGIQSSRIFVVIGSSGSWAHENVKHELKRFPDLRVIVNKTNDVTTSEYSFYAALEQAVFSQGMIVINADSIFDLRQLESLCQNGKNSSILTKKPTSINERGIRLRISNDNELALCSNDSSEQFPWVLYAGLAYISPSGLVKLRSIPNVLGTNGLIHSLDVTLGLENFRNVDYNTLQIHFSENTSPLDLRGGSFASLERKHLVRKEARGKGLDKLSDEIDWLLHLPPHLKPFFPSVISTERTDEIVWFEMPWYDSPSLRKNIMTGVYSPDKAWVLLDKVLDFMFEEVYSNIIDTLDDGVEWLVLKHIGRVRDRVTDIYSASNVMRNVVKLPCVIINGKRYRNIPECILMISERIELLKVLSPSSLRMVHGDFHFQNILVEYSGNPHGFILADPRGDLHGSDLYYDMGKLWHSFNGLYDLIHTDLCNVTVYNNAAEIEAYSLDFANQQILKSYSIIKSMATEVLHKHTEISSDSHWLLKTLFSQAMHFCSVSAFHLKHDESESRALALYLRGVQLINEFIDVSELSKYETDPALVNRYMLNEWAIELTSCH